MKQDLQDLLVKLEQRDLRDLPGKVVQRVQRDLPGKVVQRAQLVLPGKVAQQAQLVLPGKAAQQELQRLAEADRAFDCSFDMAVGYGLDAATDDERRADFRAVRGLE